MNDKALSHADRVIPVTKLQEGFRLLANNIRDFVVDSRMLMEKGHGWHAIALAVFAFEELGKYDELKRIGTEAKKKNVRRHSGVRCEKLGRIRR